MVTFSPSNFKYTDPIRYFKANDPYYYQVDNIPLKQLQENCNFLKDQIENLDSGLSAVGRATFTELQPYVEGGDNKVRVRPGRFTARINDAYSLDPVQILTQVAGSSIDFFTNGLNGYEFKTNNHTVVKDILNKFKSKLADNATNMNGLYESIFTWPMQNLDDATALEFNRLRNSGRLIAYNAGSASSIIAEVNDLASYGISKATMGIEGEFIKKWRGVARTAIVDVKNELEIEIPAFSDEDFFYINEVGEKIYTSAEHRIDLVFIYSKPIDASSTSIAKPTTNGSPVRLTEPALGIVKGAGVGINLTTGTNALAAQSSAVIFDEDGNRIIVANPSDELAENTGIGNIKGSFPSPDDLMNLTPLLAENLESTDVRLVGQSILPIAYVVVSRNAETNIFNIPIITSENLIDIRPFFRTTELSYNERAGIAAATPPVSLANPVATEIYVDSITKQLTNLSFENRNKVQVLDTTVRNLPRVISAGTIKGGWYFGVESTLYDFVQQNSARFGLGTSPSEAIIKNYIAREFYGFDDYARISNYPEWDRGYFKGQLKSNIASPGSYYNQAASMVGAVNYYLDNGATQSATRPYIVTGEPIIGSNRTQYGWGKLFNWEAGTPTAPFNFFHNHGTLLKEADGGKYNILYVKKTFTIENLPAGFSDYGVNIRYLNCSPLSEASNHVIDRSNRPGGQGAWAHLTAKGAGVGGVSWVTKGKDEQGRHHFTIFIGFTGQDPESGGVYAVGTRPRTSGDGGVYYPGSCFAVLVPEMSVLRDSDLDQEVENRYNYVLNGGTFNAPDDSVGGSHVGVAALPSIAFEVIGYPSADAYNNHTHSTTDGTSILTVL